MFKTAFIKYNKGISIEIKVRYIIIRKKIKNICID